MTPQLLELSGIGRPDVLERVGIPVKLALEGVGENVQEHIHAPVVYRMYFITMQDLAEAETGIKNSRMVCLMRLMTSFLTLKQSKNTGNFCMFTPLSFSDPPPF